MRYSTMRILAVLLLFGGCRHAEYAYAHTITGTVLDLGGKPVGDAQVVRVDASGTAWNNSLYATTTDAAGKFAFQYQGLAGEEQHGTDHWSLRAKTPDGEARGELDAPWACDVKACPGFHAEIVLRVPESGPSGAR